ncbi:MAG TPA: ornithine carbamoyltransferase [Gaiellaceae bacterium]|nr:ornithine carbamoyltransferase [Gaiellaceae bacterium]
MAAPAPTARTLAGRHLLRIADWSAAELRATLAHAVELKQDRDVGAALLPRRALGLLFRQPSTRTRVSFEVAIAQLGGFAVPLAPDELQLARGESIRDTVTTLSRYLDALVVRTLDHAELEEIARHATIPVINGLSERAHPCQALADALTILERTGRVEGARVAWVGAGTNVCASLLVLAGKLGLRVRVASPPGYEPPPAAVDAARAAAAESGAELSFTADPLEAVEGAEAVYTDVWASMGQEAKQERRRRDLAGYRVDAELLARAAPEAVVLHCLPAHDGEEITAEILHGPQSAVWDQAENRLHVQKAVLAQVVR